MARAEDWSALFLAQGDDAHDAVDLACVCFLLRLTRGADEEATGLDRELLIFLDPKLTFEHVVDRIVPYSCWRRRRAGREDVVGHGDGMIGGQRTRPPAQIESSDTRRDDQTCMARV